MINIPSQYVKNIYLDIFNTIDIQWDHAIKIAEDIEAAIVWAATEACNQALDIGNTLRRNIEDNLGNEIERLDNALMDEVDWINDSLQNDISLVWDAIELMNSNANSTVQDSLIQAYESVEASHDLVNTNLGNTLTTVQESINSTQESVGTHIDDIVAASTASINDSHALVESALAEQNATLFQTISAGVEVISGIPSSIMNIAGDHFLPLLSMVFTDTIDAMLLGKPLSQAIEMFTSLIKKMFNDLLSFDEVEMMNLVNRFQDMFTQHVANVLKGPEV